MAEHGFKGYSKSSYYSKHGAEQLKHCLDARGYGYMLPCRSRKASRAGG